MDDDLANEIVTSPKQAKSLMWYVGCFIAAGIVGIAAMLFLAEVIF